MVVTLRPLQQVWRPLVSVHPSSHGRVHCNCNKAAFTTVAKTCLELCNRLGSKNPGSTPSADLRNLPPAFLVIFHLSFACVTSGIVTHGVGRCQGVRASWPHHWWPCEANFSRRPVTLLQATASLLSFGPSPGKWAGQLSLLPCVAWLLACRAVVLGLSPPLPVLQFLVCLSGLFPRPVVVQTTRVRSAPPPGSLWACSS